MKCKLCFVLFYLCHLFTSAQITITSADIVNVGDTIAEIETEEDSLLGSIFD